MGALDRDEHLGLTGAQALLEEEESEAGTGMAKESTTGLEANMYIHLGTINKEEWLEQLTVWAA